MPRFRSSSHPSAPTEPLFVLADLQEFGAPSFGGPILGPPSAQTDATTSTTTPSPTSSSYKRFSDMSVASALSFRDDTKLDYARSNTPVRTSLSARQQEPLSAPHRINSFGALLSPEMTPSVSFQNLPIPRRRPATSPNSPPPPTSRRNARIFPPVSPRGRHLFTVRSSSTEQDWVAVTATMRSLPRDPVPDAPPMQGLHSFSDTFTGETAPRGTIRDPSFRSPPPPPQQAHSSQPHYCVSFVPSLDSPLSSSYSSSSFHTRNLNRGSSSSSANIASPHVTPASASSFSAPCDTANPSSNGKLHGISAESLFAEDAGDYRHARCSTDETETIHLEELLDKEKEDPSPSPRSSPRPPRIELSFILDGSLPSLRNESLSSDSNWCNGESCASLGDPGSSKPRTGSEANAPPRNRRTGRRPPSLQLTRTGLTSSSVSAPLEVHSDLRSRSQRRSAYVLPSLNSHLPVSNPKPQRSSVILIEDVLEDAQQFVVGPETRTHSPFGRLRSQGSSDSLLSYYRDRDRDHDPINDPEEDSPYTPRTPEFARPPSEYSRKSLEFPRLSVDSPSPNDPIFSSPPYDKSPTPSRSRSPSHYTSPDHELEFSAWPGMKKWRSQTHLPGSPSRLSPSPAPAPASAPAPLSPVVSVHSDHSVTGSIRSGITKLLSISIGGRSRCRSRSSPAEHGPGVRGSDSLDRPLPPSTTSTVSLGSLDTSTNTTGINTSPPTSTGTSRAEERKLRKEAARARTERLAQELEERARRRAEVSKARKIAYLHDKSKRPWEEAGAMYQGLSYL